MARHIFIRAVLFAAFLAACTPAPGPESPPEPSAVQPKGYILAEISVTNPDAYQDYLALVTPMVETFGGTYIVRAGRSETPEGTPPVGRVVLLEFASYDAARAFYHAPEYQAILPMRTDNATARIVILEGTAL